MACRHTFSRMHNHQKPLLSRYSYMLYAQSHRYSVVFTTSIIGVFFSASSSCHEPLPHSQSYHHIFLLNYPFLPDMYNEMSEPEGKGEAVASCIKFQPTQISGSGRQGQKWDLFLTLAHHLCREALRVDDSWTNRGDRSTEDEGVAPKSNESPRDIITNRAWPQLAQPQKRQNEGKPEQGLSVFSLKPAAIGCLQVRSSPTKKHVLSLPIASRVPGMA